jgi:serine/threonine-protein kinase
VDTRSDLYSAGCLLYELLTGRPPFVADSPVAVAYQHVREAPIPPSRLVPGIPDSVDRIVLHSLAKGRDERYQTAADFRADVEAARGGRQVAIPVMHGSNATTQYVPVQDPTGTRLAPAAGMAGGALLGGAMAGQGGQGDPYDPYNQGYNQQDPYNGNQDEYGRRQQREQEQQSNWKMILAGVAVVLVVALVGYFVSQQLGKGNTGNNTNATATAPVPDVVGKVQALAIEDLKTAGFNNVKVVQESSSDEDSGKVTKQDPTGKTTAAKDAEIVITVGSGPNTVDVPDLVGKSLSDARDELEKRELKLGNIIQTDSGTVPKDAVIKTDPSKDDSVARGTKVNLYISTGQETVPDVSDKTEAQARNALKKLGFRVDVQKEFNEAPKGQVTRTDPEAGTKLDQGSRVTIFISRGDKKPTPTTEPPVTTTASPSPTSEEPTLPLP